MSPMENTHSIHTAFKHLPIVDVSGLFSTDLAQRRLAAQYLGQAVREAGFLYIVGHGVSSHLIQNVRLLAHAYFDQPLNKKMSDYIGDSLNHSGYVPEGEEQYHMAKPDLKEAYDVGVDARNGI